MHAGEFGIVYKAYLCGWERKDSIVAVKTLRGITHMCIIIICCHSDADGIIGKVIFLFLIT